MRHPTLTLVEGHKINSQQCHLHGINLTLAECVTTVTKAVLSRPTGYSISEDPEVEPIEEEPLKELKEEGSFDLIEWMDWLSKHRAEIVCHEKVVRIPLAKGEVLQVHRERIERNLKSLKSTIAGEQKLDDIPMVRDFLEVFPKDLTGLPPHRQVELLTYS
ncbi:hypothetical protein Tco_0494348 [Tanacetum coccineum]